MPQNTSVLIAYDGSDDANAALEAVPRLFPGADVTVATLWTPFQRLVASAALGGAYAYQLDDPTDLDATAEKGARDAAAAAAERLSAAGCSAEVYVGASEHAIADDILAAAEQVGADVIVAGTRGQGGLRSALMGSVSHDLAQHADRPFVVIPSPALAARRKR